MKCNRCKKEIKETDLFSQRAFKHFETFGDVFCDKCCPDPIEKAATKNHTGGGAHKERRGNYAHYENILPKIKLR